MDLLKTLALFVATALAEIIGCYRRRDGRGRRLAEAQPLEPMPVYTRLVAADLVDYLRASAPERFDAVVAADVFCYLGDLEEVFRHAARVCRPGGRFAFSVEELVDGEHALRPSGRFAHADAYIAALTARAGVERLDDDRVAIRYENGSPTIGRLYMLTRPAHRTP